MPSIRIRQTVLEEILFHARTTAPDECCGLLVGMADKVEWSVCAGNLRASTTRYLIDPADHFKAIRGARAAGLAVVGSYHSHPASPPVPSATDIKEIARSEHLYLIVYPGDENGVGAETRGYRSVGESFHSITLLALS